MSSDSIPSKTTEIHSLSPETADLAEKNYEKAKDIKSKGQWAFKMGVLYFDNKEPEKAKEFLEKQNYTSMDLYESTQYDNVGMYNFVHLEDGVRIYSDSIKVKIALDNGQVIGYSAEEYLQTNKDRNLESPSITEEEAKQKINSKVNIMESGLAMITNDLGEEVLCHEFLGVINNDTYRIFINAKTGQEELVEKLNDEHVSNNTI